MCFVSGCPVNVALKTGQCDIACKVPKRPIAIQSKEEE